MTARSGRGTWYGNHRISCGGIEECFCVEHEQKIDTCQLTLLKDIWMFFGQNL